MNKVLQKHQRLLVCPDCRGKLVDIVVDETNVGFQCPKCGLIYPIKNGIPIILAQEARNPNLERPLLEWINENLPINMRSEFQSSINSTLALLSNMNRVCWEWEDEQFWSREYEQRKKTIQQTSRWNNRLMQREHVVKELANRFNLKGKTLIDIGCGDGFTFRSLLSKYFDETSLYLAVDISLSALELNRSMNSHKNSLYILCSEDHKLPFSDNIADVICYFGILHHTKNKTLNLKKDRRTLKKGGYLILCEALFHHPLLPSKDETSAHEEFIVAKRLMIELEREKLKIIQVTEEGTPFYFSFMRSFPIAMLNDRTLFYLILNSDIIIAKTLGHVFPFLSAREIVLMARQT